MTVEGYNANYQSGLSYLENALKEQARDCFNRAYQHLPLEQKTAQNVVYFGVLSNLAVLALEHSERDKAKRFVEEGLKVKSNHADLLYLNALLLMDEKRYDEMLEAIIHYLMALGEPDAEVFDYAYTHQSALDELYDNLLPTAYKKAFEAAAIRAVLERLADKTENKWLQKAHDVLRKMEGHLSEQEN